MHKLYWFGAMLICIAPFFIDTDQGKLLISIGLLILAIQAYKLKAYNLVICNFVGIFGYMFALLS